MKLSSLTNTDTSSIPRPASTGVIGRVAVTTRRDSQEWKVTGGGTTGSISYSWRSSLSHWDLPANKLVMCHCARARIVAIVSIVLFSIHCKL